MADVRKKKEKVDAKENKKAGRPSTYNKTFHPMLVSFLVEQGFVDKEIADKMGININTLYLWKREHKEFKDAYENSVQIPNSKVIKSLFQRATGYDYEETTMEPLSNRLRKKKDGSYNTVTSKMVVTKIVKKHALPDVAAITLWLINKTDGEWKNRQSIEGEIKRDYAIIPADPNANKDGDGGEKE